MKYYRQPRHNVITSGHTKKIGNLIDQKVLGIRPAGGGGTRYSLIVSMQNSSGMDVAEWKYGDGNLEVTFTLINASTGEEVLAAEDIELAIEHGGYPSQTFVIGADVGHSPLPVDSDNYTFDAEINDGVQPHTDNLTIRTGQSSVNAFLRFNNKVALTEDENFYIKAGATYQDQYIQAIKTLLLEEQEPVYGLRIRYLDTLSLVELSSKIEAQSPVTIEVAVINTNTNKPINAPSNLALSFSYSGTVDSNDYTIFNMPLGIAVGEKITYGSIGILDDNMAEDEETFIITAQGVFVGNTPNVSATKTLRIIDTGRTPILAQTSIKAINQSTSDVIPPEIPDDSTQVEDSRELEIRVGLIDDMGEVFTPTENTTIAINLSGTATFGTDYTAHTLINAAGIPATYDGYTSAAIHSASFNVIIPADAPYRSFSIVISEDALLEQNETIIVQTSFEDASDRTIYNTYTYTIRDDDGNKYISLELLDSMGRSREYFYADADINEYFILRIKLIDSAGNLTTPAPYLSGATTTFEISSFQTSFDGRNPIKFVLPNNDEAFVRTISIGPTGQLNATLACRISNDYRKLTPSGEIYVPPTTNPIDTDSYVYFDVSITTTGINTPAEVRREVYFAETADITLYAHMGYPKYVFNSESIETDDVVAGVNRTRSALFGGNHYGMVSITGNSSAQNALNPSYQFLVNEVGGTYSKTINNSTTFYANIEISTSTPRVSIPPTLRLDLLVHISGDFTNAPTSNFITNTHTSNTSSGLVHMLRELQGLSVSYPEQSSLEPANQRARAVIGADTIIPRLAVSRVYNQHPISRESVVAGFGTALITSTEDTLSLLAATAFSTRFTLNTQGTADSFITVDGDNDNKTFTPFHHILKFNTSAEWQNFIGIASPRTLTLSIQAYIENSFGPLNLTITPPKEYTIIFPALTPPPISGTVFSGTCTNPPKAGLLTNWYEMDECGYGYLPNSITSSTLEGLQPEDSAYQRRILVLTIPDNSTNTSNTESLDVVLVFSRNISERTIALHYAYASLPTGSLAPAKATTGFLAGLELTAVADAPSSLNRLYIVLANSGLISSSFNDAAWASADLDTNIAGATSIDFDTVFFTSSNPTLDISQLSAGY